MNIQFSSGFRGNKTAIAALALGALLSGCSASQQRRVEFFPDNQPQQQAAAKTVQTPDSQAIETVYSRKPAFNNPLLKQPDRSDIDETVSSEAVVEYETASGNQQGLGSRNDLIRLGDATSLDLLQRNPRSLDQRERETVQGAQQDLALFSFKRSALDFGEESLGIPGIVMDGIRVMADEKSIVRIPLGDSAVTVGTKLDITLDSANAESGAKSDKAAEGGADLVVRYPFPAEGLVKGLFKK